MRTGQGTRVKKGDGGVREKGFRSQRDQGYEGVWRWFFTGGYRSGFGKNNRTLSQFSLGNDSINEEPCDCRFYGFE